MIETYRADPGTAAPGSTSCTRPTFPSRDGAGRYADRRARSPRRQARARDAIRRAPPDAAGQSSLCSCVFQPWRLLALAILRLAHDPRRDLTRLDRHRLIDDASLLGVVAHLDMTREGKILAKRMTDETVVRQQPPQIGMS